MRYLASGMAAMVRAETPPPATACVAKEIEQREGTDDSKENSATVERITHNNAMMETPLPPRTPLSPKTPKQTPEKTAAGCNQDGSQKASMENAWKVKNTFIHYGSPLKTVSVATPPKSVPYNFAPEARLGNVFSTGNLSTASYEHSGIFSFQKGMAPFTMLPPTVPGMPTNSTAATAPAAADAVASSAASGDGSNMCHGGSGHNNVLRLSDFLPSPVVRSSNNNAQESIDNTAHAAHAAAGASAIAALSGSADVQQFMNPWSAYDVGLQQNLISSIPPMPCQAQLAPNGFFGGVGPPQFEYTGAPPAGSYQQQPPLQDPAVAAAIAAQTGAAPSCASAPGMVADHNGATPFNASQAHTMPATAFDVNACSYAYPRGDAAQQNPYSAAAAALVAAMHQQYPISHGQAGLNGHPSMGLLADMRDRKSVV